MQEKFYALLREYLQMVRERDACKERLVATQKGTDGDEAERNLKLAEKRCRELRAAIRRHPQATAAGR